MIELIEVFQTQHQQHKIEIKDLKAENEEKDGEIERLKKVIIAQERLREKIQRTFHNNIQGKVSKWLEFTLDEAPLDVNMNTAEIESVVSQREKTVSS